MKIKIIQKLLALFLVAGTISATPGLVIAGKKGPKETKSNVSASNSHKKKANLDKKGLMAIIKNSQNRIDEVTCLKFDILLSKQELDSDEQIKFLNIAKQLPANIAPTDALDEYVSRIVDKLFNISSISDSSEYSKSILQDISIVMHRLFYRGWLTKCEFSEHKISKILNILSRCRNSGGRGYVVETIFNLTRENFFDKSNKNQTKFVLEILSDCIEGFPENKYMAAQTISSLESKDFFKDSEQGEMQKLINILNCCAAEKDAKPIVAEVISRLSKENLSKVLTDSCMSKLLKTLDICADSEGAEKYFAKAIVNLTEQDLSYKFGEKYISGTISKLLSCAKSKPARLNAIKAISAFAAKGFLDKNVKTKWPEIMETLDIASSDLNCGMNAVYIIGYFIEKGFWCVHSEQDNKKICSKEDIKKIIDMISRCVNQEYAESIVLNVISSLINKEFLNNCDEPEIMKILGILRKCGYNEGMKPNVVSVLNMLKEKKLFNSSKAKELAAIVDDICNYSDIDQINGVIESIKDKPTFDYSPKFNGSLFKEPESPGFLPEWLGRFNDSPELLGQINGSLEPPADQANGVAGSAGQANGVLESPAGQIDGFADGPLDFMDYMDDPNIPNIFELDENGNIEFKDK